MDLDGMAALERLSDVQFEQASSELREIRHAVGLCEAKLADLGRPATGYQDGRDLPLALSGRADQQWRRWRTQQIAALQRDRAALAVREIEARALAARAFGRLQAIRALAKGEG